MGFGDGEGWVKASESLSCSPQPVPNGCFDVARSIILINQRLVGAHGEGWERWQSPARVKCEETFQSMNHNTRLFNLKQAITIKETFDEDCIKLYFCARRDTEEEMMVLFTTCCQSSNPPLKNKHLSCINLLFFCASVESHFTTHLQSASSSDPVPD